ncbi:MAG: hypothetical protein JNK15_09225 [Planctomycetes bacterium]|nr:hypothetical protein [Planctomycetota bacterium]
MVKHVGGFGLLLVVAACNTPAPQPWLRYEPAGPHSWAIGASGKLVTRLHGADLTLDLMQVDTRVEITVDNRTAAAVDIRMGPEATTARAAIGAVLVRPLEPTPGQTGQDWLPYTQMQAQIVEAGHRARFHLDAPLGRDPGLGQYFVLTVEGRDAKGKVESISMPLQATNAGIMPAAKR